MAKMLWNIFSARHPSIGAPKHLLAMAMCDNSVCVCYARKRRWTKKKNHTTKYPCILCSIHLAYQLVPFGDNGEWDARESRPTARIGRARSMSARIDQRTEFWNGICWTWIELVRRGEGRWPRLYATAATNRTIFSACIWREAFLFYWISAKNTSISLNKLV